MPDLFDAIVLGLLFYVFLEFPLASPLQSQPSCEKAQPPEDRPLYVVEPSFWTVNLNTIILLVLLVCVIFMLDVVLTMYQRLRNMVEVEEE